MGENIDNISKEGSEEEIKRAIGIFERSQDAGGLYLLLENIGAERRDWLLKNYRALDPDFKRETAEKYLVINDIHSLHFGLEFVILSEDKDLTEKTVKEISAKYPIDAFQLAIHYTTNYELVGETFVGAWTRINRRVRPLHEIPSYFDELPKFENFDQLTEPFKNWCTEYKGKKALLKILETLPNQEKAAKSVTKALLSYLKSPKKGLVGYDLREIESIASQRNNTLELALETALQSKDADLIYDISVHASKYSPRLAIKGFSALLTQYRLEKPAIKDVRNDLREAVKKELGIHEYIDDSNLKIAFEGARALNEYDLLTDAYYRVLSGGYFDEANLITSSIENSLLNIDEQRLIELANHQLDRTERAYSELHPIQHGITIANLTSKTLDAAKLYKVILNALPYEREAATQGLKHLADKNLATETQKRLYENLQGGAI